MTDPIETNYDATRDPRTGRPPLPIDVENARLAANSESETQTAEENEGIAFDEKDIADEEPDTATSVEGQGGEEVQETDQTDETAGEERKHQAERY